LAYRSVRRSLSLLYIGYSPHLKHVLAIFYRLTTSLSLSCHPPTPPSVMCDQSKTLDRLSSGPLSSGPLSSGPLSSGPLSSGPLSSALQWLVGSTLHIADSLTGLNNNGLVTHGTYICRWRESNQARVSNTSNIIIEAARSTYIIIYTYSI